MKTPMSGSTATGSANARSATSAFNYDLTPFLNFNQQPNLLAVRVDNSVQPNSRWYSGSGIYRHTWLKVTDPLCIAPWGVYAITPQVNETARRFNWPRSREPSECPRPVHL